MELQGEELDGSSTTRMHLLVINHAHTHTHWEKTFRAISLVYGYLVLENEAKHNFDIALLIADWSADALQLYRCWHERDVPNVGQLIVKI